MHDTIFVCYCYNLKPLLSISGSSDLHCTPSTSTDNKDLSGIIDLTISHLWHLRK